MNYTTVFEVSKKGFNWWVPAVGFGFFILSAVLIKVGSQHRWPWSKKWVGYFGVVFATFWTLAVFGTMFHEYNQLQAAYRRGEYATVEGVIQNFQPMPWDGHQDECFSVNAVQFCYSDYAPTAGFNNTASHGGPIRAGLSVRIGYVGSSIVKIDVMSVDRVSKN
jgi:hypothetical protein